MEILQLKQLAALVRARLEESTIKITHGQALDAIAAIPGLRNWPEVQAFPSRVHTAELDLDAMNRLAYRLDKKYGYRVRAQDMLTVLQPSPSKTPAVVPQIWPAGPRAGVYLATDLQAIQALVERYDDATDGALLYAENVGIDFENSIDLGEYGLWSNGLTRAPSGTLIVVGPIKLDQQSWRDAGERIEMACLTAVNGGHRVAILLDTPAPDDLAADVALLAREPSHDDLDMSIVGWVAPDGELTAGGVWREWRSPAIVPAVATTDLLPSNVTALLEKALDDRVNGILAFGSSVINENPGFELLEGALALTDHLGPAARIMSRHRSTMAKFDLVPHAVAQLPFLPSVESAHAQGYRRFVVDPNYTRGETFARFQGDSMFLVATYAPDVEGVVMALARRRSHSDWVALLEHLIAAVAITPLTFSAGKTALCDVYVNTGQHVLVDATDDTVLDIPVERRAIRNEDQIAVWLAEGIDGVLLESAGLSKRVQERIRSRIAEAT